MKIYVANFLELSEATNSGYIMLMLFCGWKVGEGEEDENKFNF
jgi:hypothetical protein